MTAATTQRTGACPAADALDGFVAGALPEDAAAAIEAHIDACAGCRATLSNLARGDVAPTFGRYRVDTVLGSGGMGIVYRAWDPQLARAVAIKVVRAVDGDEASRARLVREAQSLARLAHPHVCHVYDVGRDGDEVWIAMELIAGVTLRERAAGGLDRAALRTLLLGAAEGLAAAHDAGLVHRDVKPENVLVTRTDRAVVTDFGLARGSASSDAAALAPTDPRLTATGAIAGTPAYLAPEVLTGGTVDARVDQFAFAVMAWELWTGVRPFPVEPGPRLAAIRAGVTAPPGVPRALIRALAAAPSDRYGSMRDLIAALTAPPPRRRALAVAGALGAALATSGLAALALWPRAAPAPRPVDAAVDAALAAAPADAAPADAAPADAPPRDAAPPDAAVRVPRDAAATPREPPMDEARLRDLLDPPVPARTLQARVIDECRFPADPAAPDPSLGAFAADWGRVTRVERVHAQLAGRDLSLTLIEVAGARRTYRFSDEFPGGRIVVSVGDQMVVCVRDDAQIYTVPDAWSGVLMVTAAPITAPPRIAEFAPLAPVHVAAGTLDGTRPRAAPRIPPDRRYLVHARVGAVEGDRAAIGRWWLDGAAALPGVTPGALLWLIVDAPTWEDGPGGSGDRPRLVLHGVAAFDSMFR